MFGFTNEGGSENDLCVRQKVIEMVNVDERVA